MTSTFSLKKNILQENFLSFIVVTVAFESWDSLVLTDYILGSSAMMIEVIRLGLFETAVTTACVAQPDGSVTPTGVIVAISERDDLLKWIQAFEVSRQYIYDN